MILSVSALAEDFNQVIEKSVENHYDLIKEKADLEVASSYKMRAASQFLPSITFIQPEIIFPVFNVKILVIEYIIKKCMNILS